MIVRIRLETGPMIRKEPGKNRHVAYAIAGLLWPTVLTAYCLAFWALAAQVQLAGEFAIPGGVFSHWQVWAALAIALHLSAIGLNRYGRTGNFRASVAFLAWLSHLANRRTPDGPSY
jgi:membrane protein implicated in regulation of membrane protease activity